MIIFLDIDGVLVHAQHNPSQKTIVSDFDPKCVENLNRLCDALGDVEIVIESDWLFHHDFEELVGILKNAGVKAPITDRVPKKMSDGKPQQIWNWLDENYPDHTSKDVPFLIIDDDEINRYAKWIPDHKMLQILDGWERGGLCFRHIFKFLPSHHSMICPECGGELVKKPNIGEGVRTCGDCGCGWHILKTSDPYRGLVPKE
jgi:hypothetical protein